MEELPRATDVASVEAASTQNEQDNYSSNRTGQSLQVQLLGEQTNIYEELDELVEQMIQDKTAVTQKIAELEENVKGLQLQNRILEEVNAALRQQNSNLQQDLDSLPEPKQKEADGLHDAALTSAGRELQEMKKQVEVLTDQLAHARNASAELKKKLQGTETRCKDVARALVIEQSENTQIVHQLSCLEEQCAILRREKDELNMTQNKLQHRLTASQIELQVLKGRATNKQKYTEQLKAKCSTLQSALELVSSRTPTVVKVSPSPQRTRQELRLREECWKKDEMLANYAKELSVRQEEQRRQNFQLCNVMKSVEVERSKAENLSKVMENLREEKEEVEKELKQRSRKYARDLVARKVQVAQKVMAIRSSGDEVISHLFQDDFGFSKRDSRADEGESETYLGSNEVDCDVHMSLMSQWLWQLFLLIVDSVQLVHQLLVALLLEQEEFCLGKADVETNLSRIERELDVVKGVVERLRCEVEWKEVKWREEGLCWEDERTTLIKMCQEAKKQLDEGVLELVETKDNYRRLKIASTRRCTELATEVWTLKNQLKEQQELPKSLNNSQDSLPLTNSRVK